VRMVCLLQTTERCLLLVVGCSIYLPNGHSLSPASCFGRAISSYSGTVRIPSELEEEG